MRYKRRSDKNKALANAKYHVMTEMGISDIQLFRTNLIVFNWSSILLKRFKMRIVRIFFCSVCQRLSHNKIFTSLEKYIRSVRADFDGYF